MGLAKETTLHALEDLGLTRVEAEVYVYLVQHSAVTGYQIAKAIGRTRGATYGVLASLAAKGAVVVEMGDSQMWRAVPVGEFMNLLERRFLRGSREVVDALKRIEPAPPDNLVYQLKTVDQVYERARRMLASSTTIVLLDLDPKPFSLLRKDIEAAVKRGIKTSMLVVEPVKMPGARIAKYFEGYHILDHFRVHQLVVSIDCREFMISSLSDTGDRVMQACWSASPFLSWVVSTYLKMNTLAEDFVARIEAGASGQELKASYKSFYKLMPPFESPGYNDLKKMFGGK
jgi:sugar-specific transcriptional regulator TrmB